MTSMRTPLPAALALLLLFAPPAAADASQAWKKEHKELRRAERRYWQEFKKAFKDAFDRWENARDREENNPQFDFEPFHRLYEDFAAIQRQRGESDLRFARSGHPKAPGELMDELDDVFDRIERLDGDLRDGDIVAWDVFDQRPAVETYGLRQRRDLLVQALAHGEDAAGYLLGEGWKAARRRDGRRSSNRRVATLDALGAARGGGEAAKRHLLLCLGPDRPVPVRVAATQAMLARGGVPKDALNDPALAVRRAAVRGADRPAWIPLLVDHLPAAAGAFRADVVAALGRLTNQRFGDDPAAWEEWLSVYREEIEEGRFDLEHVEVREAQPKPVAAAGTFYGIPLHATGALFVIDASWRVHTPASVKTQLTQRNLRWRQEIAQWGDVHPSHESVLQRQFESAAQEFPDDFVVGLVSLYGSYQIGETRIGRASRRTLGLAKRFLTKLAADGWTAAHTGLLHAAQAADRHEGVDTIVLWSGGRPGGGPFLYAKAAIDDWRRRNRARGLTVHAVRIVDDGDEAEAYMKGIAESSGGRYVWAKRPPE